MKKMNCIFTSICCAALILTSATVNGQTISTVVGCGIGNDSLATKAELVNTNGICFDHFGNTYIVDGAHSMVRKVNSAGIIITFVGTGSFGYSGDGGPASAAQLGAVYSAATDRAGNIYIPDQAFNVIRKVNTAGIISTIAGTGTAGYSGDGTAATTAQLDVPTDILIDTTGNIIFTDAQNNRVRKINTSGIITTIVGNGATGTTGNHGPATASQLGSPFRVTMDNKGNLYVGEAIFPCVCKVDTSGILTIIADTTGTQAFGTDGDGGYAVVATMTNPTGLAVDTAGNVYFSDIENNRVRVINKATGIITSYAGTGVSGYGGDGGPATASQLGTLEGLAIDTSGNLYIADHDNNKVRKVNAAGIITTYAGQNGLFGEGYPATNAEIDVPGNVAVDASGNVYIADFDNNRIRKLDVTTGTITTVAGRGIGGLEDGFSGDGGPATAAGLYFPIAVAFDASGNMYIADEDNFRIRKVNTSGVISTVAGNGTPGYSGDGGPAVAAELNYPSGLAVDASGNIYIADAFNNRIRMVNISGVINTIAGSFTAGYSGDGGQATLARLNAPYDVAVDGMGNVFISDEGNNCIRKVATSGIISSVTLEGAGGFSGDGGSAASAELNVPAGIKVDNGGNLFIADYGNQRIRVINASGEISTIAGNGTAGFGGDAGAPTSASLNSPLGVAMDGSGNMYISDGLNYKVRKVGLGYLSVSAINPASSGLFVYPNPTNNKVTVVCASCLTRGGQLVVFNITGQQVYSAPLLPPVQTVDMSAYACGEYILQVTNNDGDKKTLKITKE